MKPADIWNQKIIFLLIIGFILRLAAVFLSFHDIPQSDAKDYDTIAINITQGKGFIDEEGNYISRPPYYPSFLSVFYYLFGHKYWTVYFTQAILGVILIFLIYYLTWVNYQKQTAILAAVGITFYPDIILYIGLLLSETLFLVFLFITLYFYIQLFKLENVKLYKGSLYTGIFAGITALIRPVGLVIPFLFIIPILFLDKKIYNRQQLIKQYILIILVMIATIFPWSLRNFNVSKTIVPVAAIDGLNFYIGNNHQANGGYLWPKSENPLNNESLSEIERNQLGYQYGLRFINESPVQALHLFITKLFRTIIPIPDATFQQISWYKQEPVMRWTITFFSILFFEIIIIGFLLSVKYIHYQNTFDFFLIILLFYFLVVNIIYVAVPRYRLPVIPVLIITGSLGLYKTLVLMNFKFKKSLSCICTDKKVVSGLLLQMVGVLYLYWFWYK